MTDLAEQGRAATARTPTASPEANPASPSAASDKAPVWKKWEKKQGRLADLKAKLCVTPPRWLLWVARAVPAPTIGWTFVARFDEVLEVLNRPDVFGVPFAAEIARLIDGKKPGTQFLLGEDRRVQHDAQLRCVMNAFRRADIAAIVTPMAHRHASRCVSTAVARKRPDKDWMVEFDVMQSLFTEVALNICVEYFGVPVGEPARKFAYATFTVSAYLFGNASFKDDPDVDAAAAYFRYFVDRAIREEEARPSGEETVVARLVETYRNDENALSECDFKQIRAFLIGMIVAFVPNNSMVCGHILSVLLKKPDGLHEAEVAAWTGDDALLESVLFEALRFMPLNPGPFRICKKEYVLAEGTPYAKRIKADSVVMPLSFAAMFDPRRVAKPKRFDSTRPESAYLHFGFGMHSCAGLHIARAHMTQTFKVLLKERFKLERASRTVLRGGMPVKLRIRSAKRLSRPGPDLDPEEPLS